MESSQEHVRHCRRTEGRDCVEHRQTSLELQCVVLKHDDCLTHDNVWMVLVDLYFCVRESFILSNSP